MKPKGRPPLIPRIDDLEKAVLILAERVQKLEQHLAHSAPLAPTYEPQFDKWPSNQRSDS